ncbi:hypothetical protein WDZ92_28595 [Nostoc sp. NIES-2111]
MLREGERKRFGGMGALVKSGGLFPSEAEIARRLSQTPQEWRAKVRGLERDGFPKIDPIMQGRFWPAVKAYWRRRYGLTKITVSQPDGGEDLDAL